MFGLVVCGFAKPFQVQIERENKVLSACRRRERILGRQLRINTEHTNMNNSPLYYMMNIVLLVKAYRGAAVDVSALLQGSCNTNALIGRALFAAGPILHLFVVINGAYASFGWHRTWHWHFLGNTSYAVAAAFLGTYASTQCSAAGEDGTSTFQALFPFLAMASDVAIFWSLLAAACFISVGVVLCAKEAEKQRRTPLERKVDKATDILGRYINLLKPSSAQAFVEHMEPGRRLIAKGETYEVGYAEKEGQEPFANFAREWHKTHLRDQ